MEVHGLTQGMVTSTEIFVSVISSFPTKCVTREIAEAFKIVHGLQSLFFKYYIKKAQIWVKILGPITIKILMGHIYK